MPDDFINGVQPPWSETVNNIWVHLQTMSPLSKKDDYKNPDL